MLSDNQLDSRTRSKIKIEMGGTVSNLLDDESVVEIMVNVDGNIWVERYGQDMRIEGHIDSVRRLSFIYTVCSYLGTKITKEEPIIECELPFNGSRFEAVIPPIVDSPIFCIRKKALRVFSLQDYVENGTITQGQKQLIRRIISERLNILIAGGTGSGKTTFANAIIKEISEVSKNHRLIIIEDTAELNCCVPNHVFLKTSKFLDSNELLRITMRLRPDRIVVGELRGAEALTTLKAWNTGHPGGLATIHANSALDSLYRLEQLVLESFPLPQNKLISDSIDLVIFIKKIKKGRKVSQILRVKGYQNNEYICEDVGQINILRRNIIDFPSYDCGRRNDRYALGNAITKDD